MRPGIGEVLIPPERGAISCVNILMLEVTVLGAVIFAVILEFSI